jgi:ribosomal protein S18 acetylase RimI-like enzyme
LSNASLEFVPFTPAHLDGVLELCEAEGWESLPADRDRAVRALTGRGVVTVVASERGKVVGFARMLTDGAIHAYLANVVVAADARRRGIGKRLVEETFARSGAERVDLYAGENSDDFYRSFDHKTFPGYRIYPERSR